MFRQHDFNSRWWGGDIGMSTDLADLMLTRAQLAAAISPYDWVELRADERAMPLGWLHADNGLVHVDTQLTYRVSVRAVPTPPAGTEIVASDVLPIDVADFAQFTAERYARVPGMTTTLLQRRYTMWATELMREQPRHCGTVVYRGSPAGYVFGQVDGSEAQFILAAASRAGTAPGLVVYLGAAAFFGTLGATRIESALSAANIAALNAHVLMRCQFVRATAIWLSGST